MSLKLEDIYGSAVPKTKEFEFGTLTISPLDLDFWMRLQSDHNKTLDDFWNLQTLTEEDQASNSVILQTMELLTCMLHAATWPYVKGEREFAAWKQSLFVMMQTYPELGEWFLTHILDSMPESKGRARPKS